jgi:hypothetical protein
MSEYEIKPNDIDDRIVSVLRNEQEIKLSWFHLHELIKFFPGVEYGTLHRRLVSLEKYEIIKVQQIIENDRKVVIFKLNDDKTE